MGLEMGDFSSLWQKIEIIKAKELLGIELDDLLNIQHKKEMNSEYTTATATAATSATTTEATTQVFDTNAKTLAEMNIGLLRENLKLQKELEVARNEKATNLEIRKKIDKLPGTHYQLQEKLETLDALVEFAKRLYKIKAFVNEKEGQSGEIVRNFGREFSGKYNLSLMVEYLEELIEMHPEKIH